MASEPLDLMIVNMGDKLPGNYLGLRNITTAALSKRAKQFHFTSAILIKNLGSQLM